MKKYKTPKFKTAKLNIKTAGAPTSARSDAYGKEAKKRVAAFARRVKK